ncbi:MAG: thioredoxin 2 [Granulosicoccus sp.]|jgi:thioredoxin 2
MSSTTEIICQHCFTSNRVPTVRLAEQPKCGRCHLLLFLAKPVVLNENGFNTYLSRSKIPILIDFWASWCGPCVQMAPAFSDAAKTLEPQVILGKVDTEKYQGVASQHSIRSLPTIVLFYKGVEISRQAGVMSATAIVQWTRTHLPSVT